MTGKDAAYFSDCIWYVGTVAVPDSAARYKTTGMLGRFCVPDGGEVKDTAIKEFNKVFESAFGGANLATYISDIQATKDILLITLGTAFLVGFVYMIVLRLCGGPIVYMTLVGLIVGSAGGGYMLF